jgi:hypothetical protein
MSDVPSNLIPTRITQLPVAPVADENSLMMIVYQGNNYQIRVGDLLSVAGVPTTRQVIAGTGMTGGGQLSSNVTLSVAPKGINSTLLNDTGVAAGVYGSATNVPVFTLDSTGRVTAATTIPATISGYVPVSTQVIAGTGLTGGGPLNSNVTLSASYSATLPQSGFQSGSVGAANTLARSDHKHPAVDLSADDQVDNILGLSNGGTARSIVAAAGAIIWSGADGLYVGPVGSSGQVLVSGGAGAPSWGSALLVVDQPANVVYAGPAAGAAAPTTFRSLVNADLPASGVTANTYGSTTAVPVITVNSKGVITSVTTATITGGLVYQGSWNALTNTPTLTSSVGTNGFYYVVSVAGTTNLNGITDWQVGDWAIFNGTAWQKIDQTNLVSSVNGQTGAVSISYADLAGAIPTWNQNTTGTAANVTGTVAIANGGSGQITAQAAMNAFAGAVASGSYLRGNGTNVVMNTIQVADVPTLNQNTTGTAAGLSATLAIGSGGTGQTSASAAFNALSPITTTGDLILGNGTNSATRLAIGANGYLLSSNGTTASWQPAPAGGVTTFSAGTTGLTPNTASTGAITLAGTLAVVNGGTGVTASSGANSVVLRDANQNITANALDDAYTNVAAAGTTTTLTVASARRYTVTGSGGQTFQLPNATTLVNGAIFEFDNNQSSGAIAVNNNSGTLVVSVPSGGIVRVNLLSNATSAGSWDRHDLTPANVSWSTNTLDYPGSITSATWNGVAVAINRGGTNGTATPTAGGAAYGTGTAYAFTAAGTAGQVLLSAGTSAPVWGNMDGGTF